MVPKSPGMGLETATSSPPSHGTKGEAKTLPLPPTPAMSPAGTKHQGLGKEEGGARGRGINK